jgi:hypothetical protein
MTNFFVAFAALVLLSCRSQHAADSTGGGSRLETAGIPDHIRFFITPGVTAESSDRLEEWSTWSDNESGKVVLAATDNLAGPLDLEITALVSTVGRDGVSLDSARVIRWKYFRGISVDSLTEVNGARVVFIFEPTLMRTYLASSLRSGEFVNGLVFHATDRFGQRVSRKFTIEVSP